MKQIILLPLFILMLSPLAHSAELCPPSSCNPHNGCTAGCQTRVTTGTGYCEDQGVDFAKQAAIDSAVSSARQSCRSQIFLRSRWIFNLKEAGSECVVEAKAQFSCYR